MCRRKVDATDHSNEKGPDTLGPSPSQFQLPCEGHWNGHHKRRAIKELLMRLSVHRRRAGRLGEQFAAIAISFAPGRCLHLDPTRLGPRVIDPVSLLADDALEAALVALGKQFFGIPEGFGVAQRIVVELA